MSGHSKWHNIQAKKGKADKARSNAFTKLARLITVAAQQGGGDPEMNFSLRLAIDKAKAVNMPKDNIERAIKRGTGESKEGGQFEEVLYEGFAPGGVAMLIEAVTDNKNRTVSEVKHIAAKNGGSIGAPGSVQWQFEHRGVIRFSDEKKQMIEKWEDVQLLLMDAGALDIFEDDGVKIVSHIESLQALGKVLRENNIEPDESGLEWVAKEPLSVDEETMQKIEVLYDALSDFDDVREVYLNML